MITKPLHPEDEDYLNATTPIPKKSFFRKAQPPPPPEPREDPSPLKQFLADLESLRKELKPVGFDQRSVMPRAWREGAEREKKMTEERRRKAGVIVERGTGAEAGSSSDR